MGVAVIIAQQISYVNWYSTYTFLLPSFPAYLLVRLSVSRGQGLVFRERGDSSSLTSQLGLERGGMDKRAAILQCCIGCLVVLALLSHVVWWFSRWVDGLVSEWMDRCVDGLVRWFPGHRLDIVHFYLWFLYIFIMLFIVPFPSNNSTYLIRWKNVMQVYSIWSC